MLSSILHRADHLQPITQANQQTKRLIVLYWAILITANIPIYLLLGWLVFDNPDNAADSILETVGVLLRAIFIPPFVRVLMGWDDEGAFGILQFGILLASCAAVVYGEHYLLSNYIFQ